MQKIAVLRLKFSVVVLRIRIFARRDAWKHFDFTMKFHKMARMKSGEISSYGGLI